MNDYYNAASNDLIITYRQPKEMQPVFKINGEFKNTKGYRFLTSDEAISELRYFVAYDISLEALLHVDLIRFEVKDER